MARRSSREKCLECFGENGSVDSREGHVQHTNMRHPQARGIYAAWLSKGTTQALRADCGQTESFGAGVEHDTSNPALSRRIGEGMEAAEIAPCKVALALTSMPTRLPRRVFQNDIHLLP